MDLSTEKLLNISQAAKRFPPYRAGRPVHAATVTRWILSGIRGPGGQRIRLEAVRRPAGWLTSVEAIERFLLALTPELDGSSASTPRSPGKRERASERAGRELDRLGI
jgi:hypothetical protein